MSNLFKAFLFKLTKDLTFRITLIIGGALAVVMTLIYFGIDKLAEANMFCNGQSMFFNSISPAQNFGIAIPVNLISFTVLEFTQGTVRNKIITGNSKSKIYFSLFFAGLVFTLALLFTYVGLCVALGSIFGGFDINGSIGGTSITSLAGMGAVIDVHYFLRTLLCTVLLYITIAAFTIFFATLFRNIGPCIPVVIIMIMLLYFSSFFGYVNENFHNVLLVVNPFYAIAMPTIENGLYQIKDNIFYFAIGNNLLYTAIFLVGGWLIFRKRDVK